MITWAWAWFLSLWLATAALPYAGHPTCANFHTPPSEIVTMTLSAYWHGGPEGTAAERRREGGDLDRRAKRLYSLQDYLARRAPYVSVAADPKTFPYGTNLRIYNLEYRYNRCIVFRVVDTGDSFRGTGTRRLDIRVDNRRNGLRREINRSVQHVVGVFPVGGR